MKLNYHMEPMRMEDLPKVAEIERLCFSQPWSEQAFASSLQSPDACYLCIWSGDTLAGYCGFLQSFDEADVMNVAIHPEMRGQGLAFPMLAELMELGKKRGVDRFTLEVRISNERAIHIYEKLGFESVGVRKRFYEKPVEDAVIMWTGSMTAENTGE